MKILFLLVPLLLLAQQAFNVKTTYVMQKELAPFKEYPATLELDEAAIVDIVPRFGGYVEQFRKKRLYERVKKGELLLQAYSPEVYKTKLELLHSLSYRDQAMIKATKRKLQLYDIPQKEILSILKRGKVSTLTAIYSPISGVIYKKDVYEGSSFKAGSLLYQIVDPTRLKATFSYPQRDDRFVHHAHSLQIVIDKESFKPTKLLYHPTTDPKSLYEQASAYFHSNKLLSAGTFAKVQVQGANRLYKVIPKSAAIKKADGWYIFVKNDFDEFEPKKVKLKPLNEEYFELLSPIEVNTTIADYPMFLLDSDAQINGAYDD